jgi:hypothetical protein
MKASINGWAAGWLLALVCIGGWAQAQAQQGPTCDNYGLSMSGNGLVDPVTGKLTGNFNLLNTGRVSH